MEKTSLAKAFLFVCGSLLPVLAFAQALKPEKAPVQPLFKDVTKTAGVGHRHHGPSVDDRLKNLGPWFTALGAGGSVGDYNNDGFEDIYVTDSLRGMPNVLYRNNGDMTFTEVGKEAGVANLNDDKHFSAMSLFFDCDGDGFKDLFVARFGRSALFKNNKDGTFKDISDLSELPLERNTVAVVALDYNRDGKLDLYLGNYFPDVDLTAVKTTKLLHDSWESARNGGTNSLLKNEGNCRFKDVTKNSGLADTGWTLAIGTGDLDKNGWVDMYLANDFGPDKMYRNNGDGTFTDVSIKAFGVDTKKGMNAELGDYDNDGWLDIYVTNITEPYLNECNMLWRNNGDFTFTDVAMATQTCDTDWGWAGKFIDIENDGWLDLYVMNGFISSGEGEYIDILMPIILDSDVDLSDTMSWPPLGEMSFSGHERNRLFKNNGNHSFDEVAKLHGVDNIRDGRGLIIADFDNDGSQDMFLLNSNEDAVLYHNQNKTPNRYLDIRLEGVQSNRDGIGTRVTAYTQKGVHYRETNAGNGYEGQSTGRVHIGLGEADVVEKIVINWPLGQTQIFEKVKANQHYVLTEGKGLRALINKNGKLTPSDLVIQDQASKEKAANIK